MPKVLNQDSKVTVNTILLELDQDSRVKINIILLELSQDSRVKTIPSGQYIHIFTSFFSFFLKSKFQLITNIRNQRLLSKIFILYLLLRSFLRFNYLIINSLNNNKKRKKKNSTSSSFTKF